MHHRLARRRVPNREQVQLFQRRCLGKQPTDLLFTAPEGGAWHSGVFYAHRWKLALDAANAVGLTKRTRIHDPRHTHASWLYHRQGPAAGDTGPVVAHLLTAHRMSQKVTCDVSVPVRRCPAGEATECFGPPSVRGEIKDGQPDAGAEDGELGSCVEFEVVLDHLLDRADRASSDGGGTEHGEASGDRVFPALRKGGLVQEPQCFEWLPAGMADEHFHLPPVEEALTTPRCCSL